jgi:glycosyltransferase involved in cell wall biosynthesis
MKKNDNLVLVVATSSKTRGGITSVVNYYRSSEFWQINNCVWIETHIDRTNFHKIMYFMRSYIKFFTLLPNASLVHIHLSSPVSGIRKLPFLALAKIYKIPIIIHFHAFSSETNIDKNYFKLYKLLFKKANSIIVLSESWKQGLIKDLNLNPSKIEVVYNPCNIIMENKNVVKTNTILFAGTIENRKGYRDLIIAFANIAKLYPKWKLVFAGNGEIKEGMELAKKLQIENQIIFKGWVSGIEKEKIFREADLFCLPSYAEGFPMSVLDAFSYGLPVITTPVGGIPEIAKDGVNMLLFNPGDINTLSEKLNILICDISLRNTISNASISFSTNEFCLKLITKKIDTIYKKIVANNNVKNLTIINN